MDWQMTANYRRSARNPKRAPVFGNTVYKWLKTLWLRTGRQTSWPQFLLLLGPGKANRNVFTLEASTWKSSNAEGRNQTLINKHVSFTKWKSVTSTAKLQLTGNVCRVNTRAHQLSHCPYILNLSTLFRNTPSSSTHATALYLCNMLTMDHRNIVNGDIYVLNLLNTDTPLWGASSTLC
jgi:hypothetical protein